jgi:glycosyltransferase involved in cell wall biosynthesis
MRGFFNKNISPCLFPITGQIDLSTSTQDKQFFDYISKCAQKANKEHSRDIPTFKLWHLNQGLDSFSKVNNLLTFYELDEPTPSEINIAKNADNLFFTNKYTQDIFNQYGISSTVIPLAFDRYSFKKLNKKFFQDDRIVFNLCGKFEKRKNHEKIIKAWVKKFGNNKKYYLQCALYNPFLDERGNRDNFVRSVDGKNYPNVQFLGHMPTNALYNDYLNSGNIIIGMSGAEGWGLPEFQSLALGKQGVILNAHSYKEWANEKNSVLVEPNGKIPAYDGVFFKPNEEFNQGNIFDFCEDDFISGCEQAIEKYNKNNLNSEGIKLQEDFSLEKTLDKLLPLIDQ